MISWAPPHTSLFFHFLSAFMHVWRNPQVARLLARLLLKWLAACCMLSDGVRAENQVGPPTSL